MSHYVVKSSQAKMPATCWGKYMHVAVLEVNDGLRAAQVKMISPRARGVIRVVKTWPRVRTGTTEKCAHAQALAEANDLAAKLNA